MMNTRVCSTRAIFPAGVVSIDIPPHSICVKNPSSTPRAAVVSAKTIPPAASCRVFSPEVLDQRKGGQDQKRRGGWDQGPRQGHRSASLYRIVAEELLFVNYFLSKNNKLFLTVEVGAGICPAAERG